MRVKCLRKAVPVSVLIGILCAQWVGAPPSQDLEILVGKRRWRVDGLQKESYSYYQLKDLASIVGLELKEHGSGLTVEGPRGTLTLLNGRPLLKFEDHYILLSGPPWKRQTNNWYVTEDFLSKAVPLVVNRQLERVSRGRYRMEELEQNRVQVRVANYPDHVRVVFESNLKSPVRVQERDKYIEVEFQQYLVRPEFPNEKPDRRFVSSVGFDASDIYGTFRIFKGNRYHDFREFTLSDPERRVVDIYGPLELTEELEGTETAVLSLVPNSTDTPLRTGTDRTAPLRRVNQNLVTIDPGHGGNDQGVNTSGDLAEKDLVLAIASQIRAELGGQGYSVMLTRTRDVELPIEHRSSVGNYYGSRVFLSVHTGGSPSPEVQGPVVYVHTYSHEISDHPLESPSGEAVPPTKPGASTIQERGEANEDLVPWEEAQRQYLSLSRGLAEGLQRDLNLLWGTQNQVVKIPLGLLISVSAPAVLIETGFLTNQEDYRKLKSAEFQAGLASVIASSVARFLQKHPIQGNPEVDGEGKP